MANHREEYLCQENFSNKNRRSESTLNSRSHMTMYMQSACVTTGIWEKSSRYLLVVFSHVLHNIHDLNKIVLLSIFNNLLNAYNITTSIIAENFQKCFNLSYLVCNNSERIPHYVIWNVLTEMFLKSIICKKLKNYLNRSKKHHEVKMFTKTPKCLLKVIFFINHNLI